MILYIWTISNILCFYTTGNISPFISRQKSIDSNYKDEENPFLFLNLL